MGRTRYKMRATVASVRQECALGHQVGDTWDLDEFTPAGLCAWAYSALLPRVEALHFGATYPWQAEPNELLIGCPDHQSAVVFRLERWPVGEWPEEPVKSTLQMTTRS